MPEPDRPDPAPPPAGAPARSSGRAKLGILALVVIGAGAFYLSSRLGGPSAPTSPPASSPIASSPPPASAAADAAVRDPAAASALRQQAYADYAAQKYRDCLVDLGKAARLDPAGDSDPRVRHAIALCFKGLKDQEPDR